MLRHENPYQVEERPKHQPRSGQGEDSSWVQLTLYPSRSSTLVEPGDRRIDVDLPEERAHFPSVLELLFHHV